MARHDGARRVSSRTGLRRPILTGCTTNPSIRIVTSGSYGTISTGRPFSSPARHARSAAARAVPRIRRHGRRLWGMYGQKSRKSMRRNLLAPGRALVAVSPHGAAYRVGGSAHRATSASRRGGARVRLPVGWITDDDIECTCASTRRSMCHLWTRLPAIYEAQAAYLERLGLLLPGERSAQAEGLQAAERHRYGHGRDHRGRRRIT